MKDWLPEPHDVSLGHDAAGPITLNEWFYTINESRFFYLFDIYKYSNFNSSIDLMSE